MKRKPSTEATAAWIRLMRVQSRVLDAVEQDLKKAGFPPLAWYDALLELSRAPCGEMRPVELEKQMLIPQYSTSRLIDRLVDEGLAARREVQDRQARPVRRDHRGRARVAEEDVERLFGRDRKACRLETVRHRCGEALRPARPARLLLRRGQGRRRQETACPPDEILVAFHVRALSRRRGCPCHRVRSVETP